MTIMWPVVWPTLKKSEIYSRIKEIGRKAEVYCLCGGNGFLDKRFKKYWEDVGMNIKLGVKLESLFEVFVFRDLIVLTYEPPDKRVQKHKYINLVKGFTALDHDKVFLKAIKEPAEIYGMVIKNSSLADKIKREVMGYF